MISYQPQKNGYAIFNLREDCDKIILRINYRTLKVIYSYYSICPKFGTRNYEFVLECAPHVLCQNRLRMGAVACIAIALIASTPASFGLQVLLASLIE